MCNLLHGSCWAFQGDLTLNNGLYGEWYQNGLRLGIEIVLNCPALAGLTEAISVPAAVVAMSGHRFHVAGVQNAFRVYAHVCTT